MLAEAEIDGGKADGAAAPIPDRDPPVDFPEAAELGGRLARLAGLQQLADMGRRINGGVGGAHRLDHG